MVLKVVGALHVAVAAVAFLCLLALDPLVVPRQRLLPQLFSIGRFRSGQWACRRSVPTRQAIEEGAQALHAESVPAVARANGPCGSQTARRLSSCRTVGRRLRGRRPVAWIVHVDQLGGLLPVID